MLYNNQNMVSHTATLVRDLSKIPQPVARQGQRSWSPGAQESLSKATSSPSDTRSPSQLSPGSHLCVSILCQAVGQVGTECAFPNATFPRQHQDPVSHRLHLLSDFLHGCKEAEEVMLPPPKPWR